MDRQAGQENKVDRAKFVLEEYKHLAYEDRPLPIGFGQTISQPYTVARMIELLISKFEYLNSKTKVLEIGTGSGYQTAILAQLFHKVYSVEIIPELSRMANKNLIETGIRNYELRIGDGKKGWREHAPYDGIIVAANAQEVPQALIDQLKVGGRIVIPVRGEMMVGEKGRKRVKLEKHGRYIFVPLV